MITQTKGIDIVVLNMPLLDTRRGKDLMGTFLSDIVLQVLSFVAENERTNIRQRQAKGIAAAKARGVKFGRPPRPLPDNFYEVHKAWRAKQLTLNQAAQACGLPAGTFYSKAIIFEKSISQTAQRLWKSVLFPFGQTRRLKLVAKPEISRYTDIHIESPETLKKYTISVWAVRERSFHGTFG